MLTQTPTVWQKLLFANAALAVVFLAGWLLVPLVAGNLPFDPLGYLIGRDFVNIWTMGQAAFSPDPGRFYDFSAYVGHLRSTLHPSFPEHNWSYPPLMFLPAVPFGLLPYVVAFSAWTLLGYAAFQIAAMHGAWTWERLLLINAAPAVLVNVYAGQNGFITAALLIGFFMCLDRRPWLAGFCLGLLAFKPQLVLLYPLALLLSRRWSVLLAAAVTTLSWTLITILLFGIEPWIAYLTEALPLQARILREMGGIAPMMMPTAFMNARLVASPEAAFAVQLPFTVLATGCVAWTFWRERDPTLSMAVLVIASFVFSPYIFNYDMVVVAWVLDQVRRRSPDPRWDPLMLALWTVPVWTVLSGVLSLPVSGLAPAAFLIWLVARLAGENGTRPIQDRPAVAAAIAPCHEPNT